MTVTINSSSNLPSNVAQECRRPWRFALCSAAVGVEGALLLAGCEAASGGLATPLCLAGAAAWAANGIAECRERYCDPISES